MSALAGPLPGPLAGLAVLVTRPAHQAGPLRAALQAAGATALAWPAVAIGPPPDAGALDQALAALPGIDIAIFVSANAVAAGAPLLAARGGLPAHAARLAVGPGSARALEAAGLGPAIQPTHRHDSEGLLALPALAPRAVAGRTVLLVRGGGGRALLADELRRRGARVVVAECYTRLPAPADPEPLRAWLRAGAVQAVTVTSRACLDGLVGACPADVLDVLRALPLAVLAPALAGHARHAGWRGAVLTAARTDDLALVEALIAWRQAQGTQ